MTEQTSADAEDDPKLFLPDILKSFRDAETENQLVGLEGEKIGRTRGIKNSRRFMNGRSIKVIG